MQDKSMKKNGSGRSPQTEPVRRRRSAWMAAAVMSIPFFIAMYFIFGNTETEQDAGGLKDLPEAQEQYIIGDKREAADREQSEIRAQARMKTLSENAFSLSDPQSEAKAEPQDKRDEIERSRKTYRNLNRQIAAFESRPKENREIERLRKQVDELTERLETDRKKTDDPVEIIERSYAAAAKYFPEISSSRSSQSDAAQRRPPVRAVIRSDSAVSVLRGGNDTSLIVMEADSRNRGFHTPVGFATGDSRSTVQACVNDDQIVTSGETVRLRLLEPMQVGDQILPVNSILYGQVSINGSRMQIGVSGIRWQDRIFPVELSAYDLDGRQGLNIPVSIERDAAKNAAANMGNTFGSSISVARSAGQQAAMDVVRGAISGGTQYLNARLQQVRIKLKAGYRLYLVSKTR